VDEMVGVLVDSHAEETLLSLPQPFVNSLSTVRPDIFIHWAESLQRHSGNPQPFLL
jgi:hypothetical protein